MTPTAVSSYLFRFETTKARWRKPIIWAVIAFGWTLLFFDTLDIRAANLDDVGFHQVAVEGRRLDYIQSWGAIQGRYYGYFAFTPIWLLDSITQPWLYQGLRLGLVALSLVVLGRLAGRITGSTDLQQWWLLVWIAVLQIPPTFYGLLSYPHMHCGLILTLLALHRFWDALGEPAGTAIPWSAGFLFFLGLQFNEAFLAFTLPFVLFWLWRIPASRRRAGGRQLLPVALACLLYLGIYVAYRMQMRPHYEGTVPGGNVPKMALYLFRYSASSMPGFELIIDRDVTHRALASWAEIGRRISTLNPWRVPWALLVGAAATWLLTNSTWPLPRRTTLRLAAGSLVVGLLFLAIPAISAKYQVFAYRRLYPHTYNFTFVHFFWMGVAITSLGLTAPTPPGTFRRLAPALTMGLMLTLICLLSLVSNPLALQQIRVGVSPSP